MRNGFKDPLEIKKQSPKDKPKDGKNSPWDFTCPQYDQRSSCFVNAGTYYGLAVKSPVGKFTCSNESAVPLGRIQTMAIYPNEK